MSNPSRADFKRRVSTRLAWLQISQKDFAAVIGMDKSVFSRAIRANSPRRHTVTNIAIGLGLTRDQLLDPEDRHVLVTDHPALHATMRAHERIEVLTEWYGNQDTMPSSQKTAPHRTSEERHQRRTAVRSAIINGTLTIDTIQKIAADYGVSTSQIHSDRSVLLRLEPDLQTPVANPPEPPSAPNGQQDGGASP